MSVQDPTGDMTPEQYSAYTVASCAHKVSSDEYFRAMALINHRLDLKPFAPPTREEINRAIDTLNRFYEHAPFGWGEIEHTVNALNEYRHRMGD